MTAIVAGGGWAGGQMAGSCYMSIASLQTRDSEGLECKPVPFTGVELLT
jgi:hypothetical protein